MGYTGDTMLPNIAMYNASAIREFPIRKNIHPRHILGQEQRIRDSYLNRKLPKQYIQPATNSLGVAWEVGLQYPWQTPIRWTYHAHEGKNASWDPMGSLPAKGDEECLQRATIPWKFPEGNNHFVKVKGGILLAKLVGR
jgi:hypothetical protein